MFRKSVKFRGKIVSKEGYRMDLAELAPVQALKGKTLKTAGDLRRHLVFLSYFHQYIPNFPRIAKPLYSLLVVERVPEGKLTGKRKNGTRGRMKSDQLPSSQPITWTTEHQKVLCTLIDFLLHPPILGYPQFEDPFVLHCDTSQDGLFCIRDRKASWWSSRTVQER